MGLVNFSVLTGKVQLTVRNLPHSLRGRDPILIERGRRRPGVSLRWCGCRGRQEDRVQGATGRQPRTLAIEGSVSNGAFVSFFRTQELHLAIKTKGLVNLFSTYWQSRPDFAFIDEGGMAVILSSDDSPSLPRGGGWPSCSLSSVITNLPPPDIMDDSISSDRAYFRPPNSKFFDFSYAGSRRRTGRTAHFRRHFFDQNLTLHVDKREWRKFDLSGCGWGG
jgi:hypothetical protein